MKETFVVGSLTITKYTVDSFLCNMYVLTTQKSLCDGNALVIDTIQSEEALQDLKRANVKKLTIILTHEHFDHTMGLNWIKGHFDTYSIAHEKCAKKILLPRNNRSLSIMSTDENSRKYRYYPPYSCKIDKTFCDNLSLQWYGLDIELTGTPGHTAASCCIRVDSCMFVGDSALLGIPALTRLPGGSQKEFDNITLPFLKTLNPQIAVFPGHGEIYKVCDVTWQGDCFQVIPEMKGEL